MIGRAYQLCARSEGENKREDCENAGDVERLTDPLACAGRTPGQERERQIQESRGRAIASGTAARAK